jgi:hypothetical protein
MEKYTWDDAELLKACWCMARADGAFDWDKINNESMPEALLAETLPIYKYMLRSVERYFSPEVACTDEFHYGACLGFSSTGCALEADLRVGDTVYGIRGGMWISSTFDNAYLQGYVAQARANNIPVHRTVLIYLQHAITTEVDLFGWNEKPLLEFLQTNVGSKGESMADDGSACELGLCEELPPDYLEEEKESQRKNKDMETRKKVRLGHLALN